MSLLPNVERELLRVARAPVHAPSAGVRVRRRSWHPRPSGAALAVAVSAVALLIGAGFLIGLHGVGAGRAPVPLQRPPAAPAERGGGFPGAPRPTPGSFTHNGLYVCRRARRNRYLPRDAGCVSVLRADMTGGGRPDLVLLYGQLGAHRSRAAYDVKGYTLEVVQPGGRIARMRLQTEPFPSFSRVGNINGIPGDELVLRLDDVSSGDMFGIFTFDAGRIEAVRPLLSAGGDSATKEGFSCTLASGGRAVVRTRTTLLLGPTIYGRWRWTERTYVFHGTRLFAIGHRSFVRRGLPRPRQLPGGAGCGREVGRTRGQ